MITPPPRTAATARHPWLLPGDVDERGPERAPRTSRDWTVDAGTFAFSLLAAAFTILGDLMAVPAASRSFVVLNALGGVLACAGLWLRRRWPVPVAAALVAVSAVASAAAMAAGIAAFTVVLYRRFPIAAAVCAAMVPAAVVRYAVHPLTAVSFASWLVISVLTAAVVLATGMFMRARRHLMLSYRERAERAEADRREHASRVRRAERDRIAREMHDVLAHRLSLLSLQAGALEFRPDATPGEVAEAAHVIRAGAHQALDDLREVIAVLREDGDEDLGQLTRVHLADVPALVEESRGAGVRVDLDDRIGASGTVPERAGRAVYQIVREALTNARKHAPGCPVHVLLTGAPGHGVDLLVANPIRADASAEALPGTGTGLIGLGERAALVGGRLSHGIGGDGRFELRAWLPWPP